MSMKSSQLMYYFNIVKLVKNAVLSIIVISPRLFFDKSCCSGGGRKGAAVSVVTSSRLDPR